MRYHLTLVASVAAGMLLLATEAAAQATGCPWCVTPTTCALVEESASGECKVTAEQGCQDGGVCVIVEADADSELALSEAAAIQRAMSLPTSTVSTSEWGDVEFSEVHPNTFVLWSCSGDVVAVAVRSADGSMQRAPITAYEGSLGLYELRSAISVVLQ